MSKLIKLAHIFLKLLQAKLLQRKVPLAISWNLTTRCNLRCTYCGIVDKKIEELETQDIKDIVRAYVANGTTWISFTGGEPLIRKDIDELIDFSKNLGLTVSLSTNGKFVPKKLETLKKVDRIKLSLDGNAQIHDRVRGKGSFQDTIDALDFCKNHNLKTSLTCVLTKENYAQVDYILDIAKTYNSVVIFQPATEKKLWSDEDNITSPDVKEYKKVIEYLISIKSKNKLLYNSISGLKHLHKWPIDTKIPCSAGKLCQHIQPNGIISACNRVGKEHTSLAVQEQIVSCDEVKIKETTKNLELYPDCRQCWDAQMVEFNLMTSFNLNAVINYFKLSFR